MGYFLVATHPSPEAPRQRIDLGPELNIGQGPNNHLVLSTPEVDVHHARVLVRDGRVIVVDLRSEKGTAINGQRIVQATIVRDRDVITIGDWSLDLRYSTEPLAPFWGRTDRERDLVAAIAAAPADDELRQVYGDWLEENGYAAEAEVLTLERKLAGGTDARALERLREVSPATDRAWRALITRGKVENCAEAGCSTSWDQLAPGPHPAQRDCIGCGHAVYLVDTRERLRTYSVTCKRRVTLDAPIRS